MLGDMNKYRPATFDEVVGQEKVVERLRNQSRTGVWFGSLILEGHWGSGKTTLARILMRAMNCEHPVDGNPCCTCASCRAILNGTSDCREIDAASNTGVDNVRSIIEWASYRPVALRYKVIVIDEAQQLSASAWNAMLKLIHGSEEDPGDHPFQKRPLSAWRDSGIPDCRTYPESRDKRGPGDHGGCCDASRKTGARGHA